MVTGNLKQLVMLLGSIGLLSVSVVATEVVKTNHNIDRASVTQNLASMPLPFTKNMGQWPDSILFRASANGATMWFTKNGIWYQFFRRIPRDDNNPQQAVGHQDVSTPLNATSTPIRRRRTGLTYEDLKTHDSSPDMADDSIETTMIKAEFVGASESVEVVGLEELEYKCNYFFGNDSSKWHTDVPNFSAVTMRSLYPGVDVTFSTKDGKLQEKIDARSGSDLDQVKVEYYGKGVSTRAASPQYFAALNATSTPKTGLTYEDASETPSLRGVLDEAISSSSGDPWAVPLSAGSAPFHDGQVGYLPRTISERQVASTASSPSAVTLVYSTYLGGSGSDYGEAIAVDLTGSAYVTGSTLSSFFPTVTPYDGILGGTSDAFVTKVSAAGNSMVFSTYLGGSGNDEGNDIAVDGAGNAYVTGDTRSSDFPTVGFRGPFDAVLGGTHDAFVTKLNPAGNSLVYSTYLGGSSTEIGYGIAVGGTGNAYVTGKTLSSDFPTVTPFDGILSGTFDAFVTKLNSIGTNLVYSTYLGGSGEDQGNVIAVDGAGNAYVTGKTLSSDFPIAFPGVAPFDGSLNGVSDAFVTKLSPAGNSLVNSTYLGGSGNDEGHGIAVDGAGSAYVTGMTLSSDFPTVTPFDGILSGLIDAFVTKVSPDGNYLVYSSYLGGSSTEIGDGIAVDLAGSAYVMGTTFSSDFPSVTPFDGSFNGGTYDVFVTKVSLTGSSLVYSTYLGGSSDEISTGIAVDLAGNAYVTGSTTSSDFPTVSSFDLSSNGGADAFLTKLQWSSCCTGLTGNVDCDPEQGIDISDLSLLIDFLYISFSPLCCAEEANTDGDPEMGIDISDLSRLIDYLYISFSPPAACM